MKSYKLIELTVVGIILPTMAIANIPNSVSAHEIKVQTANTEAITHSDGRIYVNSRGTTVDVPGRRNYRSWNPLRYLSLPWRSYQNDRQANCQQSSYQATKTTLSGSIAQTSTSHHRCN